MAIYLSIIVNLKILMVKIGLNNTQNKNNFSKYFKMKVQKKRLSMNNKHFSCTKLLIFLESTMSNKIEMMLLNILIIFNTI